MRPLHRGHRYALRERSVSGKTNPQHTGEQIVQYVNTEPGHECDGVTQQELLRMMLDRNRYCTACQPNAVSQAIEYHLRMALVLHEMRAMERKVQKGELAPEYIDTGHDGHFRLSDNRDEWEDDPVHNLHSEELTPFKPEWERPCNHHCGDPVNKKEKATAVLDSDQPARTERYGEFYVGNGTPNPDTVILKHIAERIRNMDFDECKRVERYFNIFKKPDMISFNESLARLALTDGEKNALQKAVLYAESEKDYVKIPLVDFTPEKTSINGDVRVVDAAHRSVMTFSSPDVKTTFWGRSNKPHANSSRVKTIHVENMSGSADIAGKYMENGLIEIFVKSIES